MVWFQCEDCGENLKKPKLPNHFRICSAGKLSCIDCGTTFDKKSVQAHTQCISEAEKYGPKGVACVKEAVIPNKQGHNQDGLDMNTGLSTRPPWSCSLCNVKATSQETLLLHSQGKKHCSKVRATSPKLLANSGNKVLSDVAKKMASCNDGKKFGLQSSQAINSPSLPLLEPPSLLSQEQHNEKTTDAFSVPDNEHLNSDVEETGKRKHKRKMVDDIMKDGDMKKRCTGRRENGNHDQDDTGTEQEKSEQILSKNSTHSKTEKCNSSVICFESKKQEANGKHVDDFEELPHYSSSCLLKEQEQLQECNAALGKGSKGQQLPEDWSKLVKWKKLIKRALINTPDSSMKLKKLCKSLLPVAMQTIETAGVSVDEAALLMEINNQVRSYKKLIIEGKRVRLQASTKREISNNRSFLA